VLSLRQLLEEMVQKGASDLHITAGAPPVFRIDGKLLPTNYEVLSPEMTQQLSYSVLNDEQKKRFEMEDELDLSFGIQNLSRFRANVFLQRGCVAMAVRTIPFDIRSFQDLGLPPVVADLSARSKGLVLVTGPTGCGKSTTLAAIIDYINGIRQAHIVTVEDPIEYVFRHKKCIINQRQVGSDTQSFQNALKYALREDPDVVMIGEMRDMESYAAALTISETGHLTLATLHTNSAAESINRVVDVFPSTQQSQVRAQLAFVIEGVITQQLVPKIRGGRALAMEIMVATPAIRALVRDDKIHQIYGMVQAGQKYGMQTMNQSLYQLYFQRQISLENGLNYSPNPEELEKMIETQSPTVVTSTVSRG
jgi:twitching motility protein PilT